MRAILAATAASLLVLAGCSSGDPAPTEAPPPAASSTEASQSGPIELELGETANLIIGANGPRDIDVTVTDISVSDQCHNGLNDWHDDYTHDGGYFVQVSGNIDVRESPDSFSVPQWMAADDARNVIDVASATECAYSDDPGVRTFGDSVMPGMKSTAVSEYWVDVLPTGWFLNQPYEAHAFSWPVPERSKPTSEVSPASSVAPAAAPAPAPSYVPPTFVNCYLADGTALMSDGTHQYMDSCNESAGGPMLLEDGTSIYDGYPSEWFE